MKKLKFLAAATFILALSANSIKADATPCELKQIRCTCYIEPGVTYSGHYTHEGIVAGRKQDIGDVAAIYAIAEDGGLGEFIGYYDFYDIGAGIDTDGDGKGDSLIKGLGVDMYKNDMDAVKAFIKKYGDYVYIKIIEAEG